MHENSHMMIQLLVIFATAVVSVLIAKKIKLGSIIGYLVGGLLIGPSVLKVVSDVNTITYIAEFGIVFLLFLIGIEMKPQRLWTMRRMVLGFGGAQIIVTSAGIFAVCYAIGLPVEASLIIGLGLALSSTAMGLQLLAEKGEMQSTVGRSSFSVLLMQDLAVPILLAMVAVLARPDTDMSSGNILLGIGEGVGILVLTFVISRVALKPLLGLIASARVAEVFTAFALFLVLGMAYLMETIGLSLAMGAFLAGMFLADSEYRHQIEADIQPFRGLLLGLFFMGIGMGIDISLFVQNWPLILSAMIGLMAFKALQIFILARVFQHNTRDSIKIGAFLCQAGEFGFVLFAFATSEGVLPAEISGLLMLVVAASMALTPFVVPPALSWANKFTAVNKDDVKAHSKDIESETKEGIFIIAGFGRVGQTIALQLKQAGFPYIAFDTKLDKVKIGREMGCNVFFGDASRVDVLRAAHAETAAGLILTMDDRHAQRRAVHQIRKHFPDLHLHARAHDLTEAADLRRDGVTASVPETIEASLQLGFGAMAQHPEMQEDALADIKSTMGDLRADDYAELARLFEENNGKNEATAKSQS